MDSAIELADFATADFLNLFLVPFAAMLIGVACRYGERHDVFYALSAPRDILSELQVNDHHERDEAKFEISRVGVDLVLIALVAAVGIPSAVWKALLLDQQQGLVLRVFALALAQFVFLITVVWLHLVYRYPEKFRGLYLPNTVGFTALFLSVLLFRFYAQ